MKIVVTGKNGQIGWELQRALEPLGDVLAFDRAQMDLANPDSIRRAMREARPEIVVNAAAYTAVDKAESEPALALTVNGTAPGIIAEEAHKLGAFLLHYSTDYVFDGTKASAYLEDDKPNPLSVYGTSKLAGERAIQAASDAYMILRTSWVYGTRGSNFMLTMLRLAAERDELKVVDDQIGAPTWSRSIADATARMLMQAFPPPWPGLTGPPNSRGASAPRMTSVEKVTGLFHLTAAGSTSWYGFANEIIAATQSRRARQPKLIPIPSAEYPTAAHRPKNSILSNDKFRATFGFTLEPWRESLAMALAG